ncbi:hypothetical protein [Methylobacillus flagellatus]|uniref:hypothetical protein n=1 Tax=Methylobacillus flagellatus TaxID=405 RepID=UPI0010F62CBC|nr:hypothetical protein [Methylobacillus flagellatus]
MISPKPRTPLQTDPDPVFDAGMSALVEWMGLAAAEFNQAIKTLANVATNSHSGSTVTIGTGIKLLTIDPGLAWLPGMSIGITSQEQPTDGMFGIVKAYDLSTGLTEVQVTDVVGEGEVYSSWWVFLSLNESLSIVTPPQFDRSVSEATTEFVGRAMGGYNSLIETSASRTVTAAELGSFVLISNAAAADLTITIPEGAVTGGLKFHNASNFVASVAPAAGTMLNARSAITTFDLLPGKTLELIAKAGIWSLLAGTALAAPLPSPLLATGDMLGPIEIVNGSLVTVPHSLGQLPKTLQGKLVCLADDQGVTAGEEQLHPLAERGTNGGISVRITSAELLVKFGNAGQVILRPDGVSAGIDESKWQLYIWVAA